MEENQDTFTAPEVAEVSAMFPNYVVHSLIAQGGMGAVYHATQSSLDREVAIKILPRVFSNDEEFRSSFSAEAKAMAKLNHTNLIAVHDFGESDGMLFLVMEYVPGKSLYEATHGCSLDEIEALELATAICSGLEHAHSHGILHRDIKPANILLDRQSNPKIGDFGLARPIESKVQVGESIFGTPGYTAPEVIAPPHEFDQRADVFSMGVLLYELLQGFAPEEEGALESLSSVVTRPVLDVVTRAIAPDPNERFKDCMEFIEAMEAITRTPTMEMVPTAPIEPSPIPTTGKMKMRTGPPPSASSTTPTKPAKYVAPKKSAKVPIILVGAAAAIGIGAFMLMEPKDGPEIVKKAPVMVAPTISENDNELVIDPYGKVVKQEDVQRVLDEARVVFEEKLEPELIELEKALKVNTLAFADVIKDSAATAEVDLDGLVEEWASNRYIIPDILPTDLVLMDGVAEIHREFLDKQVVLYEPFEESVILHSAFYRKRLENYYEQFTGHEIRDKLAPLDQQIEMIRENPTYLRQVILKQTKSS